MKIFEIKEQIQGLTKEVRSLVDSKDLEAAKSKMEELRAAKEALAIEEALEEEELRNMQQVKTNKEEKGVIKNMVNEMRAITKTILGKELAQEERAAIKSTGNEAILPKEYVKDLDLIKKGFGALKGYCHVIPVTKNSGQMAVVDLDQNTINTVTEGSAIADGSLTTTKIDFNCEKVGLIQTISSEVIDDAEVEVEGIIKDNFANIAVVAENKKIIEVVDTAATTVDGKSADYNTLANMINTIAPAAKIGLIILTNIEGYAYLKGAADKQGRPLNLVTIGADGKEYFGGKELVTFDSALLSKYDSKPVFYAVNMREAVKFFDRKSVSVARSTEAGFSDDTVKIRVLERLDVKEGTKRSVKRLVIGGEE